MQESDVKRAIRKYLETIPNCEVFPVATTGVFDPRTRRFRKSTGRIGCPDILLCLFDGNVGRFVAIEVKTKSGRVSEEQKKCIDAINASGGYAFVARSVDDVIESLKKL